MRMMAALGVATRTLQYCWHQDLRSKRVRVAFSHLAEQIGDSCSLCDNDNERGSLAVNRPCFNHRPRLNLSVPWRACAPKMRPSKLITGDDIPSLYVLALFYGAKRETARTAPPIISHTQTVRE
jgi:hypothetical protein